MSHRIPDPIEPFSESDQQYRGSLWWRHPSNKKARGARDLDEDGIAPILELGEWDPDQPYGTKASRSLMAWRGLWVGPSFALIEQALDRDLAPPSDSSLDWWARTYFRHKALRSVFLPVYPAPRPDEPDRVWDTYEQTEATRRRLARKIHDRYPQLFTWLVESIDLNRSPYSHPLVVCARPGYEEEFERWNSAVGLDVLLAPRHTDEGTPLPAPFAPVELLELGLRRQFPPLIEFALSAGASVNDRVLDYRKHERSLLHSAVASANTDVIDWLLDRGADLESWDRLAHTPFLVAARQGDVASMEKLAAAGANVHAVDRFGQTAAHLVVEGIRTQELDKEQWRRTGDRVYSSKSPQDIERALTRAGQALEALQRLGVDMAKPCAQPVKNTKKNPSPFAHLPRSNRTRGAAKAGETWEDQLSRRCDQDELLGDRAKAWMLSVKYEMALPLVPPEPEEGEEGPTPPRPPRPARPRM